MLLATSLALAQPPEPFHPSEQSFLRELAAAQGDPQLDLHLLQYAADPAWAREWLAGPGAAAGCFAELGSLTGRRLYLNSRVQVGMPLGAAFAFRYDRREYQDGRFDLRHERVELWASPAPGLALGLWGWPAQLKQEAVLGAGIRLGESGGGSRLILGLIDARPLWNWKTEDQLRFPTHPLRVQGEGFHRAGPWRLDFSLDFGLRAKAELAALGQSGRCFEGFQRFLDLGAWRQGPGWGLGWRLAWGTRRELDSDPQGGALSLARSWYRLHLQGTKAFRGWTATLQAAVVRQRDRFAGAAGGPGDYRMQGLLAGVELGRRPWPWLDLRAGLLGNRFDLERRGPAAASWAQVLPLLSERGFSDKLHLRALFGVRPGVQVEALLSHSLSGSSFGGASLKASLSF